MSEKIHTDELGLGELGLDDLDQVSGGNKALTEIVKAAIDAIRSADALFDVCPRTGGC